MSFAFGSISVTLTVDGSTLLSLLVEGGVLREQKMCVRVGVIT